MALTSAQKKRLLEMLNKNYPPSSNLVSNQIHFRQGSIDDKIVVQLDKKGLAERVPTGQRFAVGYLTKKGLKKAKELKK